MDNIFSGPKFLNKKKTLKFFFLFFISPQFQSLKFFNENVLDWFNQQQKKSWTSDMCIYFHLIIFFAICDPFYC